MITFAPAALAMHFGFQSACGPSLKKAGGHSIADLEFGHGWTDRSHFPRSVREWYPPWDRVTVVLST
jgi:hypothetical protein